jgi:hypothetical protein
METVMNARILIAATALTMATSGLAEPAKAPAAEAGKAASRPAQVVMASADQVEAPAPAADQPAATPAKRPRAARVTTCRCGDPAQPNQ